MDEQAKNETQVDQTERRTRAEDGYTRIISHVFYGLNQDMYQAIEEDHADEETQRALVESRCRELAKALMKITETAIGLRCEFCNLQPNARTVGEYDA